MALAANSSCDSLALSHEVRRRATPTPGSIVVPREISSRATRVLAVDDNIDVAHGVARVLTEAGYEVQTASDPVAAITLAEVFRPHVAILDIGLPVMDGYTLGSELRARQSDAPPILIALTGFKSGAGQAAERSIRVCNAPGETSRYRGTRGAARSPDC